jgi:hypothetical protein
MFSSAPGIGYSTFFTGGAVFDSGARRLVFFKFMREAMQDTLARRIKPSFFDCELSPRARTELIRRPRARWRLDINGMIGLAALVAIGFALGVYLGHERTSAPVPVSAVPVPVSPRGESLSASVAVPTPVQPAPAIPAPAPPIQPEVRRAELVTRRAELVKLPPPRAKLVGIPLGSWVRLTMPDGTLEYALFRGLVPSAPGLPVAGAPGDLYIAGDTGTAWVWVPSANNGTGAWIDP